MKSGLNEFSWLVGASVTDVNDDYFHDKSICPKWPLGGGGTAAFLGGDAAAFLEHLVYCSKKENVKILLGDKPQ